MLCKMTTAAAVAIAFTSIGASAATITGSQIYGASTGSGASSVSGGLTFTPSGGQLVLRQYRGASGVGVGNSYGQPNDTDTSVGGAEIGVGESLTASAMSGSFLLAGTTLAFLYDDNNANLVGDSSDETARITATYLDGTTHVATVKHTADTTATVTYDGDNSTTTQAPVESVTPDSVDSTGFVKLGSLFGNNQITSLVYSAVGSNCAGTTQNKECYPDSDFAIADITTGSAADVPEPGTILMFGLGLGLLGFGLRRRRDNLG